MYDKMPQIITSNLTPKTVDKVFELLNMIAESQVKDEQMNHFLTQISEFDGESTSLEERTKGTFTINSSYSQLSLLQKKIVNRTFEKAIAVSDTSSILEQYHYDIENLISNYKFSNSEAH